MTEPLHARRPERRSQPAPRHLRVVERRPRLPSGPARARALLAIAGVVAVVVVFGLVYLHVNMAQRQFEMDKVSAKLSQQQTTYDQLRLRVAQLSAPQQIIATAEGKLGMVQPTNVTYLTPSSPLPAGASTSNGVGTGQAAPGPASAVTAPAGDTGAVTAPAGDADWPTIKSQLAGTP